MTEDREAFFALVRAGLWEKEVRFPQLGTDNYKEVLRLAEEQSVVGLVAAGFEKLTNCSFPLTEKLTLLGKCQLIEQRNVAMNQFIGELVERMRKADIYAVLVKGQGIAQCYERPLWRLNGDVDFLVDAKEYEKATSVLLPLSSINKPNERYTKHIGMTIDDWYVELHGTLRTGLSAKLDLVVDEVQSDTFMNKHIRIWQNEETDIYLPSPNNDVFLVFTHFIKHFYKEGMTIRQVCDWCRLLWTHKDYINAVVIEKWLRKANLLTEWKAFAALAVKYLRMPLETMPLFDDASEWERRADGICGLLLKCYSGKKLKDTCRVAKIFPEKTLRYLPDILLNVNMLKIKERILGE